MSEFECVGYDIADNNAHFFLVRPYHNWFIRQLESKTDFVFFGKYPEFFLERSYHLIKIN